MDHDQLQRKLTAVLYADAAGYSRLTGDDEEGTHRRLSDYLDHFARAIEEHRGRVAHYAGDAVLADFDTVSDALACAVAVQATLHQHNQALPEERRVEFRIGVNLGDVIVDRDDLYGDGVNVAARLEGLADPGGICVSEAVRAAVGRKLAVRFEFLGERDVKNIAEPVRAYRVVADEGMASDSHARIPCPYPGMMPFQPEDAARFHGRESEVARMVALLRHQRFMMVIGPSGSGKSSLVQAGLLPELEHSRYFDGGYWFIRRMRPGSSPSATLARTFEVAISDDLVLDTVDQLLEAHPPSRRMLLLIDQFEEVFAQAEREEAARFIGVLQGLRTRENLALVLTLRADFYPDLMTSYLWPVDASQRVEVAPLRGDALREAIVRPAADCGVQIEAGLVERLLNDAADEPGVLPLLQETMRLLWDEMEGRTLPLAAYERLSLVPAAGNGEVGTTGLGAAIAMKADATFAELSPAEQAIARRTFLRLVQFGEGRADTRRQQSLAALRAIDDDTALFDRTLEHLTDHRLLTRTGAGERESALVDIAHESLITGWERLREWAGERREAEQVRRRLEGKAVEWKRLGRGGGGLLDAAELPEAERWFASADATDLGHGEALPALIEASQLALEQAEREREDARQRELSQAQALAEEQRRHAVAQTQATGRFRRLSTVLAGVFVVAVVAASLAWWQGEKAQALAEKEAAARQEAEVQRSESEAARTHAERLREASIAQLLLTLAPEQQSILQHERSALMARQAYLLGASEPGRLRNQADRVLRAVLRRQDFFANLAVWVDAVALDPSGRWLAASSRGGKDAGTLLLWDLDHHGAAPAVLPGDAEQYIFDLAFSPDGRSLFAGSEDGVVRKWNIERSADLPVVVARHEGGIWSMALSPDGRRIAVGAKNDDTVGLFNLSEPTAGFTLGSSDTVSQPVVQSGARGGVPVAFSPDGMTLAAGSHDGKVRMWDVSAPQTLAREFPAHEGPVWSLAFSHNGQILASGGRDTYVRVWDLRDATAAPRTLRGHELNVWALAFVADSRVLVSGGGDATTRLWDLHASDNRAVILQGTGAVYDLAIDARGELLVSGAGGADGLQYRDLRPSGQPVALAGNAGSSNGLAFSSDGQLLASAVVNEVAQVWDMRNLSGPPVTLRGHRGEVYGVTFNPDGGILSTAGEDGTVRVWHLGDPAEETAVLVTNSDPWLAPFSPDGKVLAASGWEEEIGMFLQLWNLADITDEPTILRTDLKRWINEIAFSPDGSTLAATGREGIILLQSLRTPDSAAELLRGHEGMIWSLAFSPDGTQLVSGGRDTTVRLWDLAAPDAPSSLLGRHDAEILRVRYSPDGRYVASGGRDKSVRLWDVANPGAPPVLLYGEDADVWSLAFSPDSATLAAGGSDAGIELWDLTHPVNAAPLEKIAELVCGRVWRNLTIEEWREFVSEDLPYQRTCPNLPAHPSAVE